MFITGPDVVKTVTGEDVTQQELGGARVHTAKSGVATFVAADDKACLDDVRYLLSFLPSNNLEEPPCSSRPTTRDRRCPELFDLIPDSANQPYDMRRGHRGGRRRRRLLRVLPDLGRQHRVRLRPPRRPGRRHRRQPAHDAAPACSTSSRRPKAARFVRTCDAFNIPLVTFVDVPGFLPGVDQEYGGIIRHGAKLLYAYCEATVPRIQVITRKAYGGAYVVMDSKSIGADLAFAWPSAELAVMGASGAVEIVYRRELAEADDPVATPAELVDEYTETFLQPVRGRRAGLRRRRHRPGRDPHQADRRPRACSARSARSCRSASTATCRCDGRADASSARSPRRPPTRRLAAIVAAVEVRLAPPGCGRRARRDRAAAWRFSGRWWSKPCPPGGPGPELIAALRDRSRTVRHSRRAHDRGRRRRRRCPRSSARTTRSSCRERPVGSGPTCRPTPRSSSGRPRGPHAAPAGGAAGHGRHRQRRALRRDRRAATSTGPTSGPIFRVDRRRAAVPRGDEPGRGRRDRRRSTPTLRGGEGRPHLRGHDRAEYERVPRRATSGAFGDRLLHVRGNHDALPRRPCASPPSRSRCEPARACASPCSTRRWTARINGHGRGRPARLARRARRPEPTGRCWCSATTTSGTRAPPNRAATATSASSPTTPSGSSSVVARRAVDSSATSPATPTATGCAASRHRRRAVGRGGVREGLPRRVGRVPGATRAASCRSYHRISTPEALAWTEQTRGMFGGLLPGYAFGDLADRCFVIDPPRRHGPLMRA